MIPRVHEARPFLAEGLTMSGSMLSSAALDERRRRILFRAWRRGMREMDLVMGQFADANLAAMTEAELDEFERLMEAPGPAGPRLGHGRDADARRIRHAALRPDLRRAARSADAGERDQLSVDLQGHSTDLVLRSPHRRRLPRTRGQRTHVNEVRERSRPVDVRGAVRLLEEGGPVTLCARARGLRRLRRGGACARACARRRRGARRRSSSSRATQPRAQAFIDALAFAAPEVEALYLPSWDCQPYDRVSPNAAVSAERMTALARLARTSGRASGRACSSSTVNALTQRVPPLDLSSPPPPSPPRPATACAWRTWRVARDQRLRPREHGARRRRLRDARRHPRPLPARRADSDPARLLRRHAGIDPRLRSRDAAHRRPAPLARPRADERGAAHDRDDPALPPGLRPGIRRADAGRRSLRRRQRGPARHRPRTLAAAALRPARHDLRLCRRRAVRARRPRRGGRRSSASRRSPTPTPRGAPPTPKSPAKADYKPLPPTRLYLAGDEWKRAARRAPACAAHALRAPPDAANDRRLRRPGRAQLRPRAAERERQRVRRRRRPYQGRCASAGLDVVVAGWSDGSRERLEPRARRARPQVAGARLVLSSGEDRAARARCRSR